MKTERAPQLSILVLGAYGLIGHGVSKRLIAEGHTITGLGRSVQTARRVMPEVRWIERDIGTLCEETSWAAILEGFSAVVNCSGALQDGREDDVEALHHHAVSALARTCEKKDVALIQVSAVGATPDASTRFLASKGRGDAAIRKSGANWHILRPGLVLAQNAYGGTVLLRMLAAVPGFQPIANPEAKIQTVSLDYLADTVLAAVSGKLPNGFETDLVEPEAHTLRQIVAQIRSWLGFSPARFESVVPAIGMVAVSKVADALSWFGWRSPLRSTATKVLNEGVLGTPAKLSKFGLPNAPSLKQTLGDFPVGAQDRLSARMALLFPIIVSCLSLFWLASGIIGIVRVKEASQVLENVGWPTVLAMSSVLFWAFVDIAIGTAFAFRKYACFACWAAVWVSLFYLVASTFTVPSLWLDPLGPLVKVVPGIVLALVARATLDTR